MTVVAHGHTAGKCAVQLDIDMHRDRSDQRRVDNPCHRACVVHGGARQLGLLLACADEEIGQIGGQVRGLGADLTELGYVLGGQLALTGQVDASHLDVHTGVEHARCRLGVDEDVEFGGRGPVAVGDGPAHDAQLLDPFHDARLTVDGGGDVGQRTGGDQRHVIRAHYGVDDEVDRMLVLCGVRRLRQHGTVQTSLAVELRCGDQRCDHRAAVPRIYADAVRHAKDLKHLDGIAGHVLQCAVAANGRDTQHVEVLHGEHDAERVIVSGIAVKDDLLLVFHRDTSVGCVLWIGRYSGMAFSRFARRGTRAAVQRPARNVPRDGPLCMRRRHCPLAMIRRGRLRRVWQR